MKKSLLLGVIAVIALLAGCDKQPGTIAPTTVERVTVERTLALELGAKQTLEAFVWPEDAANRLVSWASDRPGVATIDPETGEVAAVGIGEATITVTTAEGGKTAKCVVTVTLTDIIGQIPDPAFRAWCAERVQRDLYWDQNHDGKLSPDEAGRIGIIEVAWSPAFDSPDKRISSLAGIEYFTGLRELYCGHNLLTELDVSKNWFLERLYCQNNQLGSLDVSQNWSLEELYCPDNQLTTLDLSKNTALIILNCTGNKLRALDFSKCEQFQYLDCADNRLVALDVAHNKLMIKIRCTNNELTSLDVSNCGWLWQLLCEGNPGDGQSLFPVTAWFDNDSISEELVDYSTDWLHDGKKITIDFRKTKQESNQH